MRRMAVSVVCLGFINGARLLAQTPIFMSAGYGNPTPIQVAPGQVIALYISGTTAGCVSLHAKTPPVRYVRAKDFESDIAAEAGIPGPVHLAHSAGAQRRGNLVGTDMSAGRKQHRNSRPSTPVLILTAAHRLVPPVGNAEGGYSGRHPQDFEWSADIGDVSHS
jgi:hypothetical protein